MENKELLEYRLNLIRNATYHKKVERVPNISFFVTWKILDSGHKLTEAMSDFNVMREVVLDHQKKYDFDQLIENGVRNPYLLYQALGSSGTTINDEDGSINFTDYIYCESNELEEMAADYNKFIWEKGMPRKYPFWNQEFDIDIMQNAVNEFNRFGAFAASIRKDLREECAIPDMYAPNLFPAIPVETVFASIRGIKGISIDMRRNPKALEALFDTMANASYYPALEKMNANKIKPSETACFDAGTAILAHTILNDKQWDNYFWKYFKPILDYVEENGLNYMLFAEGAILRFADYFKDYKKGTVTILPENDDVFEIRKRLPNMAILGGMLNSILYNNTKEECVDYAKKLIDELGDGLLLTQNKMGSFWTDAKSENLRAVSDFVLNYKLS